MFGLLRRLFSTSSPGATAAKQEGDVYALDREGDPRGGVQSDEYRHAGPTDVVEDGVAISGPGGAPQEAAGAEERRPADRPDES
ncbi:MAG: hypothetical protein ACXVZ4_08920 [Gaiellaceae bacterium]